MEKLSVDRVREFVHRFDRFPKDQQPPPLMVNRAFYLALNILHHFLGQEWVQKERESKEGLLSDSLLDTGLVDKSYTSTGKPIRLAEMLFNLQDVPSFDHVVERLKRGDLDSHFVELESAVLFYTSGIPFTFVTPIGSKGEDYDIEVILEDGSTAAVEVESKSTDTLLNESTIVDTLKHARTQLPKDRPGLVLLNVPHTWAQLPQFGIVMECGIRKGIRNTGRIIAVVALWNEFQSVNGLIMRSSHGKVFPNDKSRFQISALSNLPSMTWKKEGKWQYLAEMITSTLDIDLDESVGRIQYS